MTVRNQQPEARQIEHIGLVRPQHFDVTPLVPLYWVKEVPNDTVRLDLYFDGGIIRGGDSIPAIVHALLLSGTNTKSSVDIHEAIDELGGFVDTDLSFEGSCISIYCLKEHLTVISAIVSDAVSNLSFRESEVEDVLQNMSQKYQENWQKVKYAAQQIFRKEFFESDQRYAELSKQEDFTAVHPATYRNFFRQYYLKGLTRMTLVGDIEQDEVDALIDLFGKWAVEATPEYAHSFAPHSGKVHHAIEGTIQTAIRMGRHLFPKTHPDYIEFQVLSTILGDYFGSRLMSNIREDKGYTYGIGSAVLEMHATGYFVIVTEVGSEVTENTLHEIYHELRRLQDELVGEEELDLVKNYMLGQLLKSADGPYHMMDIFNSVDLYGLGLEFYDELIYKIRHITPQRIQELAIKYLQPEDFLTVIAG